MFSDLLDEYLLALGEFNQMYAAYKQDSLLYGKEYRDSSNKLIIAKSNLNKFFEESVMVDSLSVPVKTQ